LYNTPKVGDKITVYKYNKTENGGHIEDGKLECVTVVLGGASLRASKTVGCKVNISPRVMLIVLGVIIAVVAVGVGPCGGCCWGCDWDGEGVNGILRPPLYF
jgi:hypothetical protein